jgi:hypothetical protein
MAGTPGRGAGRTYPVWVGNLQETVTEADLYESFSRLCDTLVNCKVMKDEGGKSR